MRTRKLVFAGVGVVVVITFLVVLFFNNPETVGFYPRCPSKMITGYDCPGCGSLRAMHALLHGDPAKAWHFNPAVFAALALLLIISIAGIHRTAFIKDKVSSPILKFSQRTAKITDSPLFPASIFIAVILWTIIRNLQ